MENGLCIRIACNGKIGSQTEHIDARHQHLRDLQFRDIGEAKYYCASDQKLAAGIPKN